MSCVCSTHPCVHSFDCVRVLLSLQRKHLAHLLPLRHRALLAPFSILAPHAPTAFLLLSPVFLVPLALPFLLHSLPSVALFASPQLSPLSPAILALSLCLPFFLSRLMRSPLLSRLCSSSFLSCSPSSLFSQPGGFSLVVFSCPVSLFPFASSFHSSSVS